MVGAMEGFAPAHHPHWVLARRNHKQGDRVLNPSSNNMPHPKTVALYGLGNMGFAIAQQLARHFSLRVYDPNLIQVKRAVETLGAHAIGGVSDLADVHAVVLCLPQPSISRQVIHDVAPAIPKTAVIIETSTVNPDDIKDCVAIAQTHAIEVIDASILAGVAQMEQGQATLALGGEPSAIERAHDVLQAMSVRQINFGASGAGAAAKVINNAVAHAVMVVVAEAGSMATAAGVSTEKLVELLADSKMGLHRPLTYRYAQRVTKGDYEGGMPLDAARKDSVLALDLAQKLGVPLFAIQGSHTVYEMAACAGYGRQDYAVIAKLWQGWGKPVTDA